MRNNRNMKLKLLILFAGLLIAAQSCFAVNYNWDKAKKEVPNGLDDDKDGLVDEGFPINTYYYDGDSDGFGNADSTASSTYEPIGFVRIGNDCDDTNGAVNPLATEIASNGLDDDCDGATDETPGTTVYYYDGDADEYGTPDSTILAVSLPAGFASNAADCDDTDANVHPGVNDVCNTIDDDCDGDTDENPTAVFYADADGDNYGDPLVSVMACDTPVNYVANSSDCNDANANMHPGATELCNGIDEDCDGLADEGLPTATYYADIDQDGYGKTAGSVVACDTPANYVTNNTDCNDGNSNIHPGATELCNSVDDDCDASIDEGATKYFTDLDGDGCGNDSALFIMSVCTLPPAGYSTEVCPAPPAIVITTTPSVLMREFATTTTIDISFTGGAPGKPFTARDVMSEPYRSRVEELNASFLKFASGSTTDYHRIKVGDTIGIGGTGLGYNHPEAGCGPLDGSLCNEPKIGGLNLDYYNNQFDLMLSVGAGGIIGANVQQDTLGALLWQIQRLYNIGQRHIIVVMGCEQVLTDNQVYWDGDGENYSVLVEAWRDAAIAQFPDVEFDFMLDAAPVWSNKPSYPVWNAAILPSDHESVRAYVHMDGCVRFNDDITHDTAQVTLAIDSCLPAIMQAWDDSDFDNFTMGWDQITATDSLYDPHSAGGYFFTSQYLPRAFRYAIIYNQEHNDDIKYINYQTLKQLIDKKNNASLEYKMLSVLYKLFQQEGFTLIVDHPYNQVDIFGANTNGVYRLVVLNRSGIDLSLPRNYVFDGFTASNISPTYSKCMYADNLRSEDMFDYNPNLFIEGFSINYLEYEPNMP
jgi:hypothetical protein